MLGHDDSHEYDTRYTENEHSRKQARNVEVHSSDQLDDNQVPRGPGSNLKDFHVENDRKHGNLVLKVKILSGM